MEKLEFSKKHTAIVKGIAILMLICYHCFSSVSRLYGYEVDFGFLSQETAIYICESMNTCVGIFAFLSAFGLTRKYEKMQEESDKRMFSIKQIIGLIGAFFIPYIICTTVTLIFTNTNPYGEGIDFFYNMIIDMLGLAGLFGTPLMIGTWWYMSFAIAIIVLTPITIKLHKKFGASILILYMLPIVFIPNFFAATSLTNMTRWLFTIPLGVIYARLNIFEKMKQKPKNIFLKIIKFVIMTIVFVLLTRFRTSDWCKQYFFYLISSLLPVYTIHYFYEFIVGIPILRNVLAYIGKHSSNIFFMHTFLRAIWLKDFTYSLKYAILIFGFIFIVSLIMSIIVEFIKKITKYNELIKKIQKLADKLYNHEIIGEVANGGI